jgi:hypothetical protein
MSLELPADAEPYIPEPCTFNRLHNPGVYALELERPDDVASAWDSEFDTRPEWFDDFADAEQVIYVGAAKDVLRRLEEHRDGQVRVGVLQRVCEITGVHNIWWRMKTDIAFQDESKIAIELQNDHPEWYVHQR